MEFDDLTVRQRERGAACQTPEELLVLAKEEGIELSDAQLESVSGGWDIGCEEYHGHGR